MFDAAQYLKVKDRITGFTDNDNGTIAISKQKFDIDTGEQIADVQEIIDLASLQERLNYYQASANNIHAFLDDLSILQTKADQGDLATPGASTEE